MAEAGAIDCDVHPAVPDVSVLLPHLDTFWRDSVVDRGLSFARFQQLSVEIAADVAAGMARQERPGCRRRGAGHRSGVRTLAVRHLRSCNCLYGVQLLFSEDMAAAFCRAINDWIAKEWLDRDPRLRASIVIPMQSTEYAVDEIERCASDMRFVQVLVLAMQEVPLGRRQFWPIYAACERHDLPLGIHAGSAYRNPVTSLGWPTWYIEDYAAQSQGFQSQVASLITEGVFAKHPELKVVLLESGVTWLPGFLWRFGKFWRGLRTEVPWVDRAPWEIVRDHFRLTMQPFDAPDSREAVERAIEHLRSDDILLYASDYPHWQFDGDAVVPDGFSPALRTEDRDRQSACDLSAP